MKACIAIGVNRVTGAASLPVLAAAASGADQFADWARQQGFDAWSITDVARPVTVQDIFSRVDSIVSAKNCTQLIVYFAGHGVLKSADTEMWLLSSAATDANAAVNLVGSVRGARKSGIPHLIFISDACRSIATDQGISEVTGSSIFPTAKIPRKPEVDIFYATMPGDVSWEVPAEDAAKRYDGIFTRCLLMGLTAPDADLVESVPDDKGASISVVSSRTLKPWIEEKVPDAVWKVDVKLNQFPELRVESQRPKYLVQVTTPPAPPAPPAVSVPYGVGVGRDLIVGAPLSRRVEVRSIWSAATPVLRNVGVRLLAWVLQRFGVVQDLGESLRSPAALMVEIVRAPEHRQALQHKLARMRPSEIAIGDTGRAIKISRLDPAYTSEVEAFSDTPPSPGFATGFSIIGAEVISARASGQATDAVNVFSENGQWHIRIDSPDLCSVLIRFRDGSGTCLACRPRYIGTITVESGRVANVSYNPSPGDSRFKQFETHRDEIEERRMVAAAASKRGYFRVEPAEAENYARNLRRFKLVDPTLGLYSAYAYAQSGLMDDVDSVYKYMAQDGFVPFDVALLAGNFDRSDSNLIAPFCPMLTQGWSLLDETVPLSSAVRDAARFLKPALWTTLTEKGLDILIGEV